MLCNLAQIKSKYSWNNYYIWAPYLMSMVVALKTVWDWTLAVEVVNMFLLSLQGIYLSRIAEGGAAHRDSTLRVGDRVISVSTATTTTYVFVLMTQNFSFSYSIITSCKNYCFQNDRCWELQIGPILNSIRIKIWGPHLKFLFSIFSVYLCAHNSYLFCSYEFPPLIKLKSGCI